MNKLLFPLAAEPTKEDLETGRKLFSGTCNFVKGVTSIAELPAADRVEICLAGRSNVGKSSLINALTNRRGIARSSNTPGRTQEINFFAVGARHYLVDLPGYGFADAPIPVVQQWQELLRHYIAGRPNLRRCFVLIDARRGLKEIDEEILMLLDHTAVSFQIVLTKTDKVKNIETAGVLDHLRKRLSTYPAAFPELLLTSSAKGTGLTTLRSIISRF
ncbi:MAG: ribosome biogenesis GTP-binding protein YihA/YsxC [Aestuariivita sp.]|nr:ribosome biogenesis GTP-binding protein YihA/YsxC [Aestuariivita sp.]